jgi:LmbE family N-acetylglucosaminyl deacetylase
MNRRFIHVVLQLVIAASLIGIFFGVSSYGVRWIPLKLRLKKANSIASKINKLSLNDFGDRLLIVAPHPDDEALGAGGLISMAVSQWKQVKVVLVTNGDCFTSGVDAYQNLIEPKPESYLQYGQDRQYETLNAAKALGLSSHNVIFLGFPDKGIANLWLNGWSDVPQRSVCTLQNRVVYDLSYEKNAPFTAMQLTKELETIITDYRPTSIVVTDSSDVNTDHWATSNFLVESLLRVQATDHAYNPKVFTYVIHSGYWQVMPVFEHLKRYIYPPKYFLVNGYDWYSLPITLDAERAEVKAISNYHTQETVMPDFLQNFERPNELFNLLTNPNVYKVQDNATLKDFINVLPSLKPISSAPQANSQLKRVSAGAYMEKLYVSRSSNSLFIAISNAGKTSEETSFSFRIMFFNSTETPSLLNINVQISKDGPFVTSNGREVVDAIVNNNVLALKLSSVPHNCQWLAVSIQSSFEDLSISSFPWRFVYWR